MKRRDILIAGSVALAAPLSGCFTFAESSSLTSQALDFHASSWNQYPFTPPRLPYAQSALEPSIGREIMKLHYERHHAGYARKLRKTVADIPELRTVSCSEMLTRLESLPERIRETVRNYGGGHLNHSLFWESMTPVSTRKPGIYTLPSLLRTFGTFSEFRTAFEEAGKRVFGSGWVWLVSDPQGVLSVMTTPNQDTPLAQGYIPLLGNDVWEHAYYLTYRTDRAAYLSQWWNIVDWDVVEKRYQAVRSHRIV